MRDEEAFKQRQHQNDDNNLDTAVVKIPPLAFPSKKNNQS